MSKTFIKKITLSISSIFMISSCSEQNEALDKKYLDKVQTLDSTINAFYAAISSDNGQSFDWDLYKYVMHPEAKLVRYGPEKDGSYSTTYYSADDYIKRYKKYMENVGFYEKEIFRGEVTSFGNISHVWSGYASFEKSDKNPIIRGINSFQLLYDKERWWVISAYYTRETPNNPIPKEYLTD